MTSHYVIDDIDVSTSAILDENYLTYFGKAKQSMDTNNIIREMFNTF